MIKREKTAEEAAIHPYKTRNGGATVTVFVPYDCKNNCPFCVNKEEYADTTGFSLEAICQSIKKMDALTPYCDFVFTGGEPLANLKSLQIMLDQVSDTHKVYINSTLPVSKEQTEEEVLAFLEHNRQKITCLNISRHMQHYVQESNDALLAKLPVKFRINCVLYKHYPVDQLVPYMERFRKVHAPSIQFRFDYTETTPDNLYDQAGDKILHDLKQVAQYTGLDGCRMRCGFHFKYKDLELVYHKTLPYSTIIETDKETGITYAILYDILIKQTGRIDSDWDDTVLDVDRYAHVKFEPYDLRWLERGPAVHTVAETDEETEGVYHSEPCSAM
ncbi:radical SAM protein [Acidaminococcus sp. NSJ-142]|uniref:4Fe-4S cluster-binding domain-containing protein n=1 Tax=Acidaminococcus TaxID=904 RepID=UPI000E519129|nr:MULTISPECIES: 4Fe-4S cluster-binding domain-containing protein [Acidaminococcus]MCD2434927.1 radical SAM protein [Acidaminococcus hominis]RHK01357.1 4Fe-4S cluster-binding domain-containing protein [Acidaminococcus sp. AM05-11]